LSYEAVVRMTLYWLSDTLTSLLAPLESSNRFETYQLLY